MKKFTYTTALIMAMTASNVFAHHPTADIVDPEIYEMIDANVADSPHADLVLDDMGNAMDQVGTDDTMAGSMTGNPPTGNMDDVGEGVDVGGNPPVTLNTIDLMENVDTEIAQ